MIAMLHTLTHPQNPNWALQIAVLRHHAADRPTPDTLLSQLPAVIAGQPPAARQALLLADTPDGPVQARLWLPQAGDVDELLFSWALPTLAIIGQSQWLAVCRPWDAADPLPGDSVQAHVVEVRLTDGPAGTQRLTGHQQILRLPQGSPAPALTLAPSRPERERGANLLGALATFWATESPDTELLRARALAQLRLAEA